MCRFSPHPPTPRLNFSPSSPSSSYVDIHLASRILSPWQQPLAAVVVHPPAFTTNTITPAEAQRQAEQGIYVVLEDGQRGETWTHTLVRCRDEIGVLGGHTFSMLDRQFMHFRGKVLLDDEGAMDGSSALVYQRLDVKGMRPGRRAGLWWSCGGVIRLGFMRDDAPTVVEAQHTCTEAEAQSFLTPIPVVEGWLETFLTNTPKRYCAGGELARRWKVSSSSSFCYYYFPSSPPSSSSPINILVCPPDGWICCMWL